MYKNNNRHSLVFSGIFVLFGSALTSGWTEDSSGLRALREERTQTKILLDGKEIAIHHSGTGLDKSYLHPLHTPDGHVVTYDAPADHVHHRGLAFGWADVSGEDFWAEIYSAPGHRGKMVQNNLKTSSTPEGAVVLREVNDWTAENGTVIVAEERTWTFYPPAVNLQLVDVETRLKAMQPEVTFGTEAFGPNQHPRPYHGLTFRIGPFLEPHYFNSEGNVGENDCYGKPAQWMAVSSGDDSVTTAILDHPQNDSHPTTFSIYAGGMEFISSSPNMREPKILKEGEVWRLRYRIVAAGAPPDGKPWNIQHLWQEYAGNDE